MQPFIRVLIADEHTLVRKGLIQLFNLSGDIRAAGEAIDGPDVIAQARQRPCELILLDLNMPGTSGLELIAQLRSMADIAPFSSCPLKTNRRSCAGHSLPAPPAT